MQNTMVRFARDEIYSWVGSLLLAVNPYKQIARLYGEEAMRPFEGQRLLNARPHVYAIAEEACRKARRGGGSQSLIISGESGAGKTESTKFALSYIVWRSRDGANGALTQRILQANPLLESLGNAKTVRNHNSSRFGKCVRLCTDPNSGALLGAYFHTYLLEKSRVVQFGPQERNSTSSTSCSPSSRRRSARLAPGVAVARPAAADSAGAASAAPAPPASSASATSSSAARRPPSLRCSRRRARRRPRGSTTCSGGRTRRRRSRRWASRPTSSARSSRCSPPSSTSRTSRSTTTPRAPPRRRRAARSALGAAAHVLGASNLETLLTVREMAVKDEVMRIELRADQAAHARDGLLKSLYGLAFGWVVAKINTAMRRDGGGAAYVGGEGDVYVDALDIFGFENFGVNSFEQLCINFANEKLHQLFLYAMFKAEHEVIALEKVSLPPVDYADNERCLQMLERAPSGVFHLLDTCCRVNSSPSNFCLQVHAEHAACEFLVLGINGCNEDRAFTVRHFAGDVEYAVDDFPKKNAETMEVMTRQLLATPALAFLQATYDDAEETRAEQGGGGLRRSSSMGGGSSARCSARARRRAA